MKLSEKFDTLIADFRFLTTSKECDRTGVYQRFDVLLHYLSANKVCKKSAVEASLITQNLASVLTSFRDLKKVVYESRLDEARLLIDSRSEMFKVSSFELMEHNFRENTHSNILQYLFDYNFTSNSGIESLLFILSGLQQKPIDNIKSKLYSRKYKVEREFPVTRGRVDLLIKDDENKFIIVVENKILASITEKEFDESDNVTATQLDFYQDYFLKHDRYKGYDKVFIPLTYSDRENPTGGMFEIVSYDTLYRSIIQANFEDVIVEQYLILLYSILKNLRNKSWLIEQSNAIKASKRNLNLNSIEALNLFTYGR